MVILQYIKQKNKRKTTIKILNIPEFMKDLRNKSMNFRGNYMHLQTETTGIIKGQAFFYSSGLYSGASLSYSPLKNSSKYE
jgi:predicted small secreted protein